MIKKKLSKINNLAKSRFKVQVVADSISPKGKRVTTFLIRYPRFITPEVLTHTVLTKSSSSSRAIPAKKIRDQVLREPMVPVEWGANNPGMQSKSLLSPVKSVAAYYIWRSAAISAVGASYMMEKLGVHKQIVNRITEFAQPVNVVITGTEWANFFALRCDADAQPEFQYLAELMYDAYSRSTPVKLKIGEWHLPFVNRDDVTEENVMDMVKVSVARCARTSYRTNDGKPSKMEDDLKLYDRLIGGEIKHSNPAGHQAQCVNIVLDHQKSNLFGWLQYRKLIPGECIKVFRDITDE